MPSRRHVHGDRSFYSPSFSVGVAYSSIFCTVKSCRVGRRGIFAMEQYEALQNFSYWAVNGVMGSKGM